MSRKLTAALILLMVAILLVPQGMTAAQSRTVRVRVWHGLEDGAGRHTVSPSTTLVAHYIWVAKTAELVEDFMAHADITLTIDDQPVFSPQPGKDAGWEAIEVSELNELARAQWTFPLPALEPGEHTLKTVIALDAEVSDGIEAAPFSGVVNETTNVITVTGGAQAEPAERAEQVQPTEAPAVTTRTTARTAPTGEIHCNAVVGTFVRSAVGHWAPDPDKRIAPEFVVPAGKSLWTFGMDENHEYYQVLLDVVLFWVEADALAPTADDVWNNAPLPNCVVE